MDEVKRMPDKGIADGIATVLNALPTTKLISTVSAGIGKMYEPRHKRKMAEATAYEINAIGEAMRNAADLPIVYNQDGIAINSEDFNRLMQRAGTRLVLQETIKQHNIESVIDNAYEILEKEEKCSDEPVEQGWINRFFDSVADISDEDLQKLWGKVLAGEIKQPKSYSLRTLETLKNLSTYEAKLFERVTPFITRMYGNLFLTSEIEILRKYEISYDVILCLDECGLINSDGMVSYNPKISINDSVAILSKSKLLLLKGTNERPAKISIGIFGLTRAGKELFSILEYDSNESYLSDFAEEIEKNNKGNISITLHQLHAYDGVNIRYNTLVLREFPPRAEEEKEQSNDQL